MAEHTVSVSVGCEVLALTVVLLLASPPQPGDIRALTISFKALKMGAQKAWIICPPSHAALVLPPHQRIVGGGGEEEGKERLIGGICQFPQCQYSNNKCSHNGDFTVSTPSQWSPIISESLVMGSYKPVPASMSWQEPVQAGMSWSQCVTITTVSVCRNQAGGCRGVRTLPVWPPVPCTATRQSGPGRN